MRRPLLTCLDPLPVGRDISSTQEHWNTPRDIVEV
jgi:hypothetical protein